VAALREALDIDVELIKGRGGIFEVAVDGTVVVKKTLSGFPDEAAIVAAVRAATT
jgi:selenoprotein W-related protein